MKKHILVLFILPFLFSILHAQDILEGSDNCQNLEGTLRDKNTDETIPFAKVALYQLGQLISGQDTNQGGEYSFENIPTGEYDVKASIYGYDFVMITKVRIESCVSQFVDLDFEQENGLFVPIMVMEYAAPHIRCCIFTCGNIVVAPTIQVDPLWDTIIRERNLPSPAEKDPQPAPKEIALYPNPSYGLVNIESDFEILGIQLYDLVGHNLGSVQYQDVEKGKVSMDLSNLAASTYILQLIYEGGNQTEKVIILEE